MGTLKNTQLRGWRVQRYKTMRIEHENVILEVLQDKLEFDLVPLRLCISGHDLGTLDDATYLPSFIGALKSLVNDAHYYDGSINEDNYKEKMLGDNNDLSDFPYGLTLEETFDDFSKRVVWNKTHIYMGWCLNINPFFNYKNITPEQDVFVSISKKAMSKVVEELEAWYLSIHGKSRS